MSDPKDSQMRKAMITINNPLKIDLTSEKVRSILNTNFKSLEYYCMAEEIGGKENTHHLHVFCMFNSPVRFSTIKKQFPTAHIDKCRGSARQNRDYVFKTGKWIDSEKSSTSLKETQYESSELPRESEGKERDLEKVYELIKAGYSTTDIIDEYPHLFPLLNQMEQLKHKLLYDDNREKLRPVFTVYIHGRTGTGKTRFVLQKHKMSEIYKITDYNHPFDRYSGEKCLFLEEFRSSLPLSLALMVLDIYPMVLPARYSQKQACYDIVYIVSNEPIHFQYPDLQITKAESYKAFLRRIHLNIDFNHYAEKYETFEERFFALSKYIDHKHSEYLNNFDEAQRESAKRLQELEEAYQAKQVSNTKAPLTLEDMKNLT